MTYADVMKERRRLIWGYTGKMLMGSSLIYLLPLLLIPFYAEESVHVEGFLIPAAVALITGFLFNSQGDGKDEILTTKEGGVIVLIIWTMTVLISALPYAISGGMNFTHSVFESMSGWTTTGLSVVDVQKASKLLLLWRSLTQFLGGAGLAVIMLSAIIGPHGFGFYSAEGREDVVPNVVKSAKSIMAIYISYYIIGAALYIEAGMPIFEAINHSACAIATGGFTTRPGSIGSYDSIRIEIITIMLMLLGSINFGTHYMLVKGEARRFFKLGEIRLVAFVLSLFMPLVFLFSTSRIYESAELAARTALFELTSALTGTGYTIVDYNSWDDFGMLVVIMLMIIGGGTCSTAGGIKQYRVLLLFKALYWNMRRYFAPKNEVRHEYIERADGQYEISSEHTVSTACFAIIYMSVYIAGVIVFTINGYSLRDSMFEFASAIGTVGLSLGLTSPDAPGIILWTEIVGMFLGRLEFFVVFFGFINLVKLFRVQKRA